MSQQIHVVWHPPIEYCLVLEVAIRLGSAQPNPTRLVGQTGLACSKTGKTQHNAQMIKHINPLAQPGDQPS